MSIRAVTDLAVDRDLEAPGEPTAQFSDALTKAIPTESLTAYTSFIALVQTQATTADPLLGWRWAAFIGFLALTAGAVLGAYYRKASSRRPALLPRDETWGRWAPIELAPVLLASIAWGLALPGGPLSAELTGATGALTLGAIVIVGGALVGATCAPLRTATSTPPPGPNPPAGAVLETGSPVGG